MTRRIDREGLLAALRSDPNARQADLAARFGCYLATVSRVATWGGAGMTRYAARCLSPEQAGRIARLRKMRRAGKSWGEIGLALGISKQGAWWLAGRYAPELLGHRVPARSRVRGDRRDVSQGTV